MLPAVTIPSSLCVLLTVFRSCFTAPTFETFRGLVCGLIAQTGSSTVTGMLTGAGLERVWSHDRAHHFFSGARWDGDRVGLALARLIVERLLPAGAPLPVVVDDTAHRRRGKKVHGVSWIHDGSAPGRQKLAFGHQWVVVALIVALPFLTRPVALPVLVRRWKGKGTPSVTDMAADMTAHLADAFPGRLIHVTADAAYHSKTLRDLPACVTWTTRLPRNAVLYAPAPPRTGKRGRPRIKGERLGRPADLAATATWRKARVHRYGRLDEVHIAEVTCLWYGVFHAAAVRVILVRDKPGRPLLALVTTDLSTGVEELVTRYAARWAIEVTFFDCRQTLGVGQTRNRTRQAVERTFPFGMYVYSLVIVWYASYGHRPEVVTQRRWKAPWYQAKHEPSYADMQATLRRTLIAARFLPIDAGQPADHEIRQVQQAWASAAP